MPLLGGLFGRKHKASIRSANAAARTDPDSALSSPTNSYVTADKSLPSSPNGRSILSDSGRHLNTGPSPSSKLRLPFSRKKSRAPFETPAASLPNAKLLHPPRPLYLNSGGAYDSDSGDTQPLPPPPPKSAFLAAYTDPSGALSTQSLPTEAIPSAAHRPPREKRPSFFSWSKDAASSKPLPDPKLPINLMSPLTLPESDSSFNLKSFRHLRPHSPNASNSSLVVPPPRPRQASVNSDSSQRISVAAFREAHARRSAAGSPAPSFRSPSPSPGLPLDGQRGRTGSRPSSQAINQRRSTNLAVGYTSDSDESTSSEEEDSDDGLHRRNGTTRNRGKPPLVGKRQAKSEIGHGSPGYSVKRQSGLTTTQSHHGHGDSDQNARQSYVGRNTPNYPTKQASRSPSDLAASEPRRRASNSTSALSPSAAAKRASVLADANAAPDRVDPMVALRQTNRHVRDSSTVSNPSHIATALNRGAGTDSESDEDDAPLAYLVPPRRPGSSMSSASNASLKTNGTRGPNGRVMSKPLIDINELTTKKPTLATQKSNDVAFTGSGLIAGQMHGSHNALVESPTSVEFPPSHSPLTSKSPPGSTHFARPLSPSKELEAHLSLDPKLSPSQSSASNVEQSPSPERRRDVLTERLAKLAKANVNADEPSAVLQKKSSSPPPPQRQAPTRPELTIGRSQPLVGSQPSPPDDVLIQDVDHDILQLISRMGESVENVVPEASSKPEESEKSSDSESDSYGEAEQTKLQQEKVDANAKDSPSFPLTPGPEPEDKHRIAPIPIRQRAPAPSFSVMSRPPIQRSQEDDNHPSPTTITTPNTAATAKLGPSSAKSLTNLESPINTPTKVSLSNARSSTNLDSTPSTSSSIPSSTVTQRQRSSTMIPFSTPSSTFGTSTSSFAKLTAREGSVAPSSTYTASNVSASSLSSHRNAVKPPSVERTAALKTMTSTYQDGASSGDKSPLFMNPSPSSRHRSSTIGGGIPDQPLSRPANASPIPSMPVKPFAMRRDSPASSTGDSSSGRAPLTPRDGSDVSAPKRAAGKGKAKEEWGSGVSGLGPSSPKSSASGHGHGGARRVKRRSVSFEDEIKDAVASGAVRKSKEADSDDSEMRRRDRRRSEAKAAIELGNVINGPGPVVSDDEDDLPTNQAMNAARMSTVNPMMGMNSSVQMQFNGGPAAWGGNMSSWPQQARPQILSPASFMMPPPPEPNFYAAHHQAMMYAKRAYQMAVAQQAMAAAADEWERSSVMGGSVYGGGSSASVMMSSPQYGMMGGMNNGWSTGSMIYPSDSQSVYGGRGINSSRSEYGGGGPAGGGGKWSSARTSYGESFGPSDRLRSGGGNRHSGVMRDSGYYPPVPPIPQNHGGKSTSAKARNRTTSGPAVAAREGPRKPPPSSWKAGV